MLGSGRRNLAALDGIRGVAILLVLANHFGRFLPRVGPFDAIRHLCDFGWIGVDLFFVLSGFLITGILLQTKTSKNYFGAFYARRVLRIFPLYYAALLVVFLGLSGHVLPAAQAAIPLPEDRWLYYLYLTNWLNLWHAAWGPNILGHFWSLAVEEQFYLVWPFCVLAVPERFLPGVTVGLSLVALLVRAVWVAHTGPSQAIAIATVTRMDALLLGAFAATLYRRAVTPRAAIAAVPIGLTALALFAAGVDVLPHAAADAFTQTIGYSLLAIGFGALVLKAALTDGSASPLQRIFTEPVLKSFGKYSYGIYVYHVPLLGACEILILKRLPSALTENPIFSIGYVLLLVALSYGIARVSFTFFERPILSLKRFFEPSVIAKPTRALEG